MTSEKWKKEAKELIKKHEGLRIKIYKCPAGKLTIGYGHNLEDNTITLKTAEFMLNEDFDTCLKIAEGIFGKTKFGAFPDPVKTVIINMVFNLGGSRFETFKKMIKCVKAGDYRGAGEEIINSKAYTQNKRRYKELADIMIGAENAKK